MRISRPVALGLRISIVEGSLFSVYWAIVAGVIMNGLLLAIGADPFYIAILNGLPLLSQLFALPSAKIIQDRDVRKPFTLLVEGIARAMWLFVPLIFVLPIDNMVRIWLILIIAGISHCVHAGGAIGWISWVSDMVPEQIRGLYFGVRGAICGIIGTIGLTAVSVWVDRVKSEHGPGHEYLHVLLILVAVSVIFAAASWIGLVFQPVKKLHNLVTTGWGAIWQTLREPSGRRIAVVWSCFAFASSVTGGLYMPFWLDRVHMSYVAISIFSWISLITVTIMTPLWGRFADRFGNRLTLGLAYLGVFWQPLLYVFTPNTMRHVWGIAPVTVIIDAIASGLFWPAVGLAQTNIAIAESPSQTRAGLFAMLSALTGVIGFAGVALGGLMTRWVGIGHVVYIGPIGVDDIRLPMLVGSILRFLTGFLIFALREPPRQKEHVSTGLAFDAVWKLMQGRPVRNWRSG